MWAVDVVVLADGVTTTVCVWVAGLFTVLVERISTRPTQVTTLA